MSPYQPCTMRPLPGRQPLQDVVPVPHRTDQRDASHLLGCDLSLREGDPPGSAGDRGSIRLPVLPDATIRCPRNHVDESGVGTGDALAPSAGSEIVALEILIWEAATQQEHVRPLSSIVSPCSPMLAFMFGRSLRCSLMMRGQARRCRQPT